MQLPFERVVSIIAHRAAGNGIRQTEKLCDVNRDTVMRWSRLVGEGCARLLDRSLRDLKVLRIQADELHTFVHARQRRLRLNAPPEHGDVWDYLAEDEVSRAIITYALGKRSEETTRAVGLELRARTVGRAQINTDGYPAYVAAIARAFGQDVDLAQVVKAYESGRNGRGLAVADQYVSSKSMAILGRPDLKFASTSYVERLNCTVRLRMSKFGRRTPRHAKSVPHLRADLSLFVAVYNFVDVHSTLKQTPAQALGITDHPWSLDELIKAALAEPPPPPLPIRLPEPAVTSKVHSSPERVVKRPTH